ncbi:MAG: hypothetical protein R2843_02725 [Thermomicrobiales bacterium]
MTSECTGCEHEVSPPGYRCRKEYASAMKAAEQGSDRDTGENPGLHHADGGAEPLARGT